jgi:hypothetical protein
VNDQLSQTVAFCAGRYSVLRDGSAHALALGYLAILNRAREFRHSSADPERDLLDWLSKPHSEANLDKACKEVRERCEAALDS